METRGVQTGFKDIFQPENSQAGTQVAPGRLCSLCP